MRVPVQGPLAKGSSCPGEGGGAEILGHPCHAFRVEQDLPTLFALVFADTIRKGVIRDYTHVHRRSMPNYSTVDGSDSGEVYVGRPMLG